MPLYLDNNATTALDPQVLDAMLPYMQAIYGNPSSVHRYGRLTRDALEQARVQVARLAGAQPGQVIFTSGGTEANNLAIKGSLSGIAAGRIAVSAIEHASLLDAAHAMEKRAWQVDVIAVDQNGIVSEGALSAALRDSTRLVSVMQANNETGVIQDVNSLCRITQAHDIWFHTDASQAAGKIAIDFAASGVNMMTLSSHKLYGPQGVGALIADRAIDIEAQLQGGGQERGLRSGTENIAGIVGFGMAAEIAQQQLDSRAEHTKNLRNALQRELDNISSIRTFAATADRLPNTVQFSVQGFDGEALLMQLDRKGIAVSSGSACHSGKTEPSHVLMAMGVEEQTARNAIRVSFGKDNKAEDVTLFMDVLKDIIEG
ncbi:MAG: cysteine desulfurase [Gammaproteobacteria bacterium]|nr:cysteine desulfurase [Gammaproteobacteria bacterium]